MNHLRHITDSGIYKSFFDYHPDAVYIVDLAGNFLDANPACFEFSGYSRDEFLSNDFAKLVVPEKLDDTLVIFKELLRGKSARTFETAIFHSDGHPVPLLVTVTPIIINGDLVGVFGIAKDITEQKITEQIHKEGKERYKSLKRYNPNGICSFDLDKRVLGANPAFVEMTGYTLDELKSLDVTEALELHHIVIPGIFLENMETKIKHKDGHLVDVRATSVPIIIEGTTIGLYLILIDITKEKRHQQELFEAQWSFLAERMAIEEKLQQSEARYRRLVNNSLDAIGVIEDGRWKMDLLKRDRIKNVRRIQGR